MKNRQSSANPIIEFVGLPGAGKSTICKRLRAEPPWQNAMTTEGVTALWRQYSFITRWPIYLYAFLDFTLWLSLGKLILATGGICRFPYVKRLLLLPFKKARVIWIAGHEPFLLLMDQGLLQALWSALISLPNVNRISPLHKSNLNGAIEDVCENLTAGLNYTCVHFHVKTETAINRIQNRTHGLSRFEGPNALLLKAFNLTIQAITEAAQRHVTTYTLNAEGTTDEVFLETKTILAHLRK